MMTDIQRNLAAENLRLAIFLAKKYGREEILPFRDDVGTALEGLCKAAASYTPGKVPFSAYAAKCVCNEFARTEQFMRYGKHAGDMAKTSLEVVIRDGVDPLRLMDTLPASDNVESEACEHIFFDDLRELLDDRDYKIALSLSSGKRQIEIANDMAMTKANVQYRIRMIRQKIERSGLV